MITKQELIDNGWTHNERDPYTGSELWNKDDKFFFDPRTQIVQFIGGEFSTINRLAKDIVYLEQFYEVLK